MNELPAAVEEEAKVEDEEVAVEGEDKDEEEDRVVEAVKEDSIIRTHLISKKTSFI